MATSLTAISPIDGRYADKVNELRSIFSEMGLNQFRILVEIRWLEFLANCTEIVEIKPLSIEAKDLLNNIYNHFSEADAEAIKTIERKTNHDVKAIEYFLKEKIQHCDELNQVNEFIHFACTSEDINNLAYSLMLQTAQQKVLTPNMQELITHLRTMAQELATIPMLARTHGQAATPTTMGKEIANFVARLQRQEHSITQHKLTGKMNGAVGNYNAHAIAYPEINWPELCQQFVTSLDLEFNAYTTQIEPHDAIAQFAHNLQRFNTILIDLSRDMWAYISLDYFKQKMLANEVGSSTMPHKVNPIDFENAEGNLALANNLLEFLSQRLPISRWQRDLVDSTLMRNWGVALAHTLIAYKSLLKGLSKLEINEAKLRSDLNDHWEVVTEAIQTVMRRYKIANPYEQLKAFSRGKKLDAMMVQEFINSLDLPAPIKQELLALTPENYLGYAAKLAKDC